MFEPLKFDCRLSDIHSDVARYDFMALSIDQSVVAVVFVLLLSSSSFPMFITLFNWNKWRMTVIKRPLVLHRSADLYFYFLWDH